MNATGTGSRPVKVVRLMTEQMEVYPMTMFPTLSVAELGASVCWR